MPTDPTAWLKSEDRCLDERPLFGGLCQRSDGHTIEQISTRHECHVLTEAEPLDTDLLFVWLVPASDSAIGLDPARLGSLDERSEAANLGLVSLESGRIDLPLEREVLLMESDLLRPRLVTMVELTHDGWWTVVPTPSF
jgi:hypothetical protein